MDEAFVEFAGDSIVGLVPEYDNLLVSRTLSKAHSLAGFRVGYAVLPEAVATDLNTHDDAYSLARPSQAAAIATLAHARPTSPSACGSATSTSNRSTTTGSVPATCA